MTDVVFIEDLRIETVIGVFDWEKEVRQVVSLDLEMSNDNRAAASTDRLEDTLDYWAVSMRLIEFVGSQRFELMETLAERCAEILLRDFGLDWLRLRARKLGAVRGSVAVGVMIERGPRAGSASTGAGRGQAAAPQCAAGRRPGGVTG